MSRKMRFMFAVVMAASITGLTTAQQVGGKANAAKAQIGILGKAMDAYRVKYTEYPAKLNDLVEKKLVLPEAIIDPWNKEFKYDVTGKRNNGKTPDIWTVAPSKVTIGNWLEKKK